MKIMMMAQCYAPEEVSAAILITELAVDLVKKGHQVTIITGAPSYPYGSVFPGYRNRLYQVETIDGVRVVRTWSYITKEKTFWKRIFHYGTYSASAFYGALFAGRPDVLVSFSPPLPLGLTAWLLSRVWQVPWVLQLEDLYPDAAVAAGVLKNPLAISAFSWMETFEYQNADHISLISESFRKNLLGKGVPSSKITFVPIWADPDLVKPMQKTNSFRSRHGLDGKFIVMYAGNLGLTGSLEDLIAAAELLRSSQHIHFLIIGEGVKKKSLEEIARERSLENIQFLPYQPREIFPEMMAAADINVVTLNSSSALSSLPSKIFNIMSSARPILGVTPLESELAFLIDEARCGIVVPPENPEQLANAILDLERNETQAERMGENGRRHLVSNYSRCHCTSMFEQMLEAVVQRKGILSSPVA